MAGKRNFSLKNLTWSGIRGNILCIVLAVLIGGLFMILIYGGKEATKNHEKFITTLEGCILLEGELRQIERDSDTMVDTIREYAETGDSEYLDQYLETYREFDTDNTVIADVRRYVSQNEAEIRNKLTDTLTLIGSARERELRAMSLLVAAYDEEAPEELEHFSLSEDEMQLEPEQLVERAKKLLYSDDCQSTYVSINRNMAEIQELFTVNMDAAIAENAESFRLQMRHENRNIAIIILLFLLMLLSIIALMLLPIRRFTKNLKNGEALQKTLSYEFNSFATIYNDNYQLNETSSLELKKQADYDALTGLLNRGSFNRISKKLKVSKEPLALLWIDVDIFKSINDNYGHEIGDQALKKVANLLKDTFRSKDYPIRYGGDEFLVIMMGISPSEKDVIGKKIDYINDVLLHPEEPDFPAFSVSVGIAFDHNGYSEELFRKADRALYYRKESGRCGYTFYQKDNM